MQQANTEGVEANAWLGGKIFPPGIGLVYFLSLNVYQLVMSNLMPKPSLLNNSNEAI